MRRFSKLLVNGEGRPGRAMKGKSQGLANSCEGVINFPAEMTEGNGHTFGGGGIQENMVP